MKEKLFKLQQLHKATMKLQREINKEFANKPISINQDYKGEWSGAGYNLKIDRVDVREDDVGILYTVFDGDEEYECIDGMNFDGFIKYAELA